MTRGGAVVGFVKERCTKSSRNTDPFGALGGPDEGRNPFGVSCMRVAPRANLLASVINTDWASGLKGTSTGARVRASLRLENACSCSSVQSHRVFLANRVERGVRILA